MTDILSWMNVGLDDLPAGLSVLVCGDALGVQQFLYRCTAENLARGSRTALLETVVPPAYVLSALADDLPMGKGGGEDGTFAVDVLPEAARERFDVLDCSVLHPRRLAEELPSVPGSDARNGLPGLPDVDERDDLLRRIQGVFTDRPWTDTGGSSRPRGAGLPFVDADSVAVTWGETASPSEVIHVQEPRLSDVARYVVEQEAEVPPRTVGHFVVHRLDEFWHLYSPERLRSTINSLHERRTRCEHVTVAGFGEPVESEGVSAVESLFDVQFEVRTRDAARGHPVADVADDLGALFDGEHLEARVTATSDLPRLDDIQGLWFALPAH